MRDEELKVIELCYMLAEEIEAETDSEKRAELIKQFKTLSEIREKDLDCDLAYEAKKIQSETELTINEENLKAEKDKQKIEKTRMVGEWIFKGIMGVAAISGLVLQWKEYNDDYMDRTPEKSVDHSRNIWDMFKR